MDTVQLDLDVVLPDAHDHRDRCVEDLVAALGRFDGVDAVHVTDSDGGTAAKVCLHLQPGAVSIARIEERARAAGAVVSQQFGHLIVHAASVGHAARARALTARLVALPGVVDGAVSIEGTVRVEYDRSETTEGQILDELHRLGLRGRAGPLEALRGGGSRSVTPTDAPTRDTGRDEEPDRDDDHGHGASRLELVAAGVSLGIYIVARSLDWFTTIDGPVTALYIAAAVITGVFVARDAWLSVRARIFDIDQLMLIAAVGAALLGNWSDSALLLVLFSLGHALEGYAMGRARNAIEALGELAPATARLRDDPTKEIPLAELAVGDVVIIRPHERLPADGVVVVGETSIDESAVTGESIPVDKSPISDPSTVLSGIDTVADRHRVFAGTLNGSGAVDVMVLRAAADSTLARVVQLVAEAETQISPTQRLTQRIVRIFVPAVLALVVTLIALPPLLGAPFSESFARAMAVLVAASPCALAIATPSAVLAAIARAARSGILIKGGGPLEALGGVTAIAFDKTGTLTEGRPVLVDIEPAAGIDSDELLRVTLAVEKTSDHPVARAVTAGAAARFEGQTPDAANVTTVIGKGVTGELDQQPVMIGSAALFDDVGLPPEMSRQQRVLEERGRTTMIVRHGETYLGVLGVMDTPRSEAGSAIEALRGLGIETVVLLSGDNQRVATAVAEAVGITDARGGLLPEDKVDAINRLADDVGVAMVGDGVNDAPALAAANVGIAMGTAGSDVALETADIALMADRIDRLSLAVSLSRRARRTIRQNLFFSLAVVAALIPMTVLGLGISVAVIAHEGSTLVVVANALRLLKYKEPS